MTRKEKLDTIADYFRWTEVAVPDVKRWCEGWGDWHACHERLLCPKCAEKEATDG